MPCGQQHLWDQDSQSCVSSNLKSWRLPQKHPQNHILEALQAIQISSQAPPRPLPGSCLNTANHKSPEPLGPGRAPLSPAEMLSRFLIEKPWEEIHGWREVFEIFKNKRNGMPAGKRTPVFVRMITWIWFSRSPTLLAGPKLYWSTLAWHLTAYRHLFDPKRPQHIQQLFSEGHHFSSNFPGEWERPFSKLKIFKRKET